jgi:ABC-type protease/lipase transport system fused ATPase/permease subunit
LVDWQREVVVAMDDEFLQMVAEIVIATLACSGTCCIASVLIGVPLAFLGSLAKIWQRHEERQAVRELREYLRREKERDGWKQ